ncbi:NAD-dependent deacetylase hst3 [Sorochytrium milnesiophthora]
MTSDKTQVSAVAQAIHRARRIVVVTGAGISVSAGIPDFRSSDGLYNLVKEQYPDSVVKGQELFDARLFASAETTMLFYTFMAGLKAETDKATATATHRFIKSLADSGKLLRCYTQNIDGLERRAGLRMDSSDDSEEATDTTGKSADGPAKHKVTKKNPFRQHHVVQLHGTLAHVNCIVCRTRYDFSATIAEQFLTGTPPDCPACTHADSIRAALHKRSLTIGTLRPSIILYNEVHPQGDLIAECAAADVRRRPDMLIVMGTSLKVAGIKRLVRDMAKTVRAHKSGMCVLLNKTPLSSVREWRDTFHVVLEEECDAVVCKWEAELAMHAKLSADRKEKRDRAKTERERRLAENAKGQTILPYPVVKLPAQYAQQQHFALSVVAHKTDHRPPIHLSVGSDTEDEVPEPMAKVEHKTPMLLIRPRSAPSSPASAEPPSSPLTSIASSPKLIADRDYYHEAPETTNGSSRKSPTRSPTKEARSKRRPYSCSGSARRKAALPSVTVEVFKTRARPTVVTRSASLSDCSESMSKNMSKCQLFSDANGDTSELSDVDL